MPFQIVRNDITKMHVDAIVNTASPVPGYGPGIDTAVYKAAGEDKLLAKRRKIGDIAPGESAITDGYDLPSKHIIHTVGVFWDGGDKGEEDVVRSCYRSVFKLALDNDINSLAIPLLASGSYGFPKGIALRIALSEIESFMAENELEVYLVVFDEKAFSLSSELYGDIDEYINDNYVEEKVLEEYWDEECAHCEIHPSESRPSEKRRRENDQKDGNQSDSRQKETHHRDRGFPGFLSAVCGSAPKASKMQMPQDESELADFESAPMMESMMAPVMARSLDDVVNNLDKTFMELVFSFADEKQLTDVEVQKRANLDRKAFSKLRCGTTKNPSKATALALAVALELNIDETKDLLSRAGFALSPCSKQDVIVQYFIEREAYDIYEINLALFEHGEQLLGSAVGV